MKFNVAPLGQSSIAYLYVIRDQIAMDPEYQRKGEIWNPQKRQLLIDSIINGYDIPKLYFHALDDSDDKFAVIDGKQRLQAIWGFMLSKFSLATDFIYLKEPDLKMSGMSYQDLAKVHPRIRAKFDSFVLPVYCIRTDDLEVIEEMFTRLNEGSPLNAAEKRNALGGPIPPLIRKIAESKFFQKCISFGDSRYRYLDLACKLLFLEKNRRVTDTKKMHLDAFVKNQEIGDSPAQVEEVLGWMSEHFTENDPLLKAAGTIPIYYLLFRLGNGVRKMPIRSLLLEFETRRSENRAKAKEAEYLDGIDLDLLEYDRLSQSPNDSAAIQFRIQVLANAIGVEGFAFESLKNFPIVSSVNS
jgi:hypothetical protein